MRRGLNISNHLNWAVRQEPSRRNPENDEQTNMRLELCDKNCQCTHTHTRDKTLEDGRNKHVALRGCLALDTPLCTLIIPEFNLISRTV